MQCVLWDVSLFPFTDYSFTRVASVGRMVLRLTVISRTSTYGSWHKTLARRKSIGAEKCIKKKSLNFFFSSLVRQAITSVNWKSHHTRAGSDYFCHRIAQQKNYYKTSLRRWRLLVTSEPGSGPTRVTRSYTTNGS